MKKIVLILAVSFLASSAFARADVPVNVDCGLTLRNQGRKQELKTVLLDQNEQTLLKGPVSLEVKVSAPFTAGPPAVKLSLTTEEGSRSIKTGISGRDGAVIVYSESGLDLSCNFNFVRQ